MDKLEPILKYKFWILFLVAFLLSAAGYFMTVGEVQASYESRKQQIVDTANGVASGAGKANDKFAPALKERVAYLEAQNTEVIRDMWVGQLASMSWPGDIARFMKPGYRSELAKPAYRGVYGNIYEKQIEDTWRLLEPVLTTREERIGHEDDPQKILVDRSTVPLDRTIRPNTPQAITSEKMWDAQEDIWYLRSLFKSIARANAESNSVADATIRQISKIRLVGGDGVPVLAGAGTSGASSAMGGGGGGMGGYDGGMGGYDGGFGGGGGGGGGRSQAQIGFDPAEEFGASGEPAGGGGDFGGMPANYDYGAAMGGGGGGGATAAADANPIKRYVAYTEGDLYRERGFYLSMLVEQDAMFEVLAHLSNGDWPTRIVRYQFGQNPYYEDKVEVAKEQPAGGNPFAGGPGSQYGGSEYGYGGDASPDYGGMGGGMGGPSGPGGFGVQSRASALRDESMRAAISSPNLVSLEVAGVITMYNSPTEDVLPIARQPVPVNGQPYALLDETATEAEAEQVSLDAAAADIAAEEEEKKELDAAKEAAGLPTEEAVPVVPADDSAADSAADQAAASVVEEAASP